VALEIIGLPLTGKKLEIKEACTSSVKDLRKFTPEEPVTPQVCAFIFYQRNSPPCSSSLWKQASCLTSKAEIVVQPSDAAIPPWREERRFCLYKKLLLLSQGYTLRK
jgi:hypothetical protein